MIEMELDSDQPIGSFVMKTIEHPKCATTCLAVGGGNQDDHCQLTGASCAMKMPGYDAVLESNRTKQLIHLGGVVAMLVTELRGPSRMEELNKLEEKMRHGLVQDGHLTEEQAEGCFVEMQSCYEFGEHAAVCYDVTDDDQKYLIVGLDNSVVKA